MIEWFLIAWISTGVVLIRTWFRTGNIYIIEWFFGGLVISVFYQVFRQVYNWE